MTACYIENDSFAAQWLRNLIAADAIAPGVVIENSIANVAPNDIRHFKQVHVFAGIGVWSYALRLAGFPDDRRVFTFSCPCQPFSGTGLGGGFDDKRHLWPATHHLIESLRPELCFGEQVASPLGRTWLDLVLDDLDGSGYTAGAVDLPACSVGAPHIRQRLWIMGYTEHARLEGHTRHVVDPKQRQIEDRPDAATSSVAGVWAEAVEWLDYSDGVKRPSQSKSCPMADVTPNHVGRVRAYGNAIVAELAAEMIGAGLDIIEMT